MVIEMMKKEERVVTTLGRLVVRWKWCQRVVIGAWKAGLKVDPNEITPIILMAENGIDRSGRAYVDEEELFSSSTVFKIMRKEVL
jgi:hypothetical protein